MKYFPKSYIFPVLLSITLAVSIYTICGCAGAGKQAASNKWTATATINNTVVTESQIRDEASAELEAIELRRLRDAAGYARAEHDAIKDAMDRLLEEKMLALEAAEQDISKEQLIAREIRQKITDPTEEEIDLVYEMNRERVNRPKEDVEDQIIRFLRERSESEIRDAFMRQLEQKYNIGKNLEPLRFDVKTAGRPSMGPDDAPVKLVLFSDFQCPYCRDFSVTLSEIVSDYNNKVQLVFRHLPLTSIHPDAQFAAEASLCAHEQGRFWEMHDILFENQRELTEENIMVKMLLLDDFDLRKYRECFASGRHKSEIREDLRAAAAAGADSTPTLYINGIYLSGGQPYRSVAAIINKELTN